HQVSLILPNQEKGIVIPGSGLTVPVGGTGGGLPIGTASTAQSGTTNNASTLFGSPTTVNPTTSTTTSSSTTNNTVTVSFGANFNGNRDLHTFGFDFQTNSNLNGVFLSASPQASNLSKTGGISGTLSLTSFSALAPFTNASGRLNIQACAESLS